MKTTTVGAIFAAAMAVCMLACNKDATSTATDTQTLSQETTVAAARAIAVAATATGDSVYVVNVCAGRQRKDSIAAGSLPALAKAYLDSSYTGYTATSTYQVVEASGTVAGYVAVISYNGSPVGVLFDPAGNFVRVLEQREGHDLVGRGWHEGGRFGDRGGTRRDSIAVTALPAAITQYYALNYSTDTIVRAFTNRDSSIVVISSNGSLYASLFTASGTFVKREVLTKERAHVGVVAQADLPAAVQTYLDTTYPGYVFKQAFRLTWGATLQGFVVVIDANSTKYAVVFDANGAFVKAVTVR